MYDQYEAFEDEGFGGPGGRRSGRGRRRRGGPWTGHDRGLGYGFGDGPGAGSPGGDPFTRRGPWHNHGWRDRPQPTKEQIALRRAIFGLLAAGRQVGAVASAEQQVAARQLLDDARREMYRLLADAPATDGSPEGSQPGRSGDPNPDGDWPTL